jgi:hypothetical protein
LAERPFDHLARYRVSDPDSEPAEAEALQPGVDLVVLETLQDDFEAHRWLGRFGGRVVIPRRDMFVVAEHLLSGQVHQLLGCTFGNAGDLSHAGITAF